MPYGAISHNVTIVGETKIASALESAPQADVSIDVTRCAAFCVAS